MIEMDDKQIEELTEYKKRYISAYYGLAITQSIRYFSANGINSLLDNKDKTRVIENACNIFLNEYKGKKWFSDEDIRK